MLCISGVKNDAFMYWLFCIIDRLVWFIMAYDASLSLWIFEMKLSYCCCKAFAPSPLISVAFKENRY